MPYYKMCDTEDLIALNKKAIKFKFNRALDHRELIDLADPDGTHILSMVLFGHNADSAAIFHHRAEVLIKRKGSTVPERAYIDVADRDWDRLTDVPDAAS